MEKMENSHQSNKEIFLIVNTLMGLTCLSQSPSLLEEKCNDLADFFLNMISDIYTSFTDNQGDVAMKWTQGRKCTLTLLHFSLLN